MNGTEWAEIPPDPNRALAFLLQADAAGLLDKTYIRRQLDED